MKGSGGAQGLQVSVDKPMILDEMESMASDPILSVLQNSCTLSIDQFLKNHLKYPETQMVLKSIMAYLILMSEKRAWDRRFAGMHESERTMGSIDWIQQVLTRIDIRFSSDDELISYLKETVFITFNYDRVLEYFLRNFLKYDRNMPNYAEILAEIKIFHINGSLGDLNRVMFGKSSNIKYVALTKNMRTVWEGGSTIGFNQSEVRDCVKSAERIFVLGTSYISDNNEAIGLNDVDVNKTKIYGTALGLSEANINRVMNELGYVRNYKVRPIQNVSASDLIIDYYTL